VSRLDYFVVGPHIALETLTQAGPPATPRLALNILLPPRRNVGCVHTELHQDHVTVVVEWHDTDASQHAAEAVRLAARVIRKLTPLEIRVAHDTDDVDSKPLLTDGFLRLTAGYWFVSAGAPFPSGARAPTMDALYTNPFDVVWNFEPRTWEILAPLLVEASRLDDPAVLDVGCGFGKNARLLQGLGVRTYGVDIAHAAIAECRRWVRHPERFIVGSLQNLPYSCAGVDLVLDIGALHCLPMHLLAPAAAEIARVLKPGGWLFSRALLPRSAAWIAAQHYQADRVGLDPAALIAQLEPYFDVAIVGDVETIQVRAQRRT
jgi:hypothetical protein